MRRQPARRRCRRSRSAPRRTARLAAIALVVARQRRHRHRRRRRLDGHDALRRATTRARSSTTCSPTAGRRRRSARPASRWAPSPSSSSIDEMAEKLGMDPLALRDKLDAGPASRRRAATTRRRARRARPSAGSAPRSSAGTGGARRPATRAPVKRGLGMAQSMWGRFVELDSSCEVRLHRDGSVEFLSSVQDIGTGTRTALAMIVAEELGVRPEDVTMKIGDTAVSDRAVVGRIEDAARHHLAGARGRVARQGAALPPRRRGGARAAAASKAAAKIVDGEHQRAGDALARTTAATRTAATAACSSPRSPSTPRPASSRSSAWSRCTTAGASSTRWRCSRRSTAASCTACRSRSTRTATWIARPGAWSTPTSSSTRSPMRQRDARDRGGAHRAIPRAQRHRRAGHRRAGQHPDGGGDRQRRVQRHRRAHREAADEAGGRARRARQARRQGGRR